MMRPYSLLLLLVCACSEPPITPPVLDGDGTFYVTSPDPERPRLRYLDGQVSLNRTCAIRLENKLNPAVPPMYVNGAPIGFC